MTTKATFSSLTRFALANLGDGFKEHAHYYILIAAIGIALTLGSPRLAVIPLQWLFPFFALAFAMRRFDPRFRMMPDDVIGIVIIGFVTALAIGVPLLILFLLRIPLLVPLALIATLWPLVKWSLAAPLYLMWTSPRRSQLDAMRDSWNLVAGERWWVLFWSNLLGGAFVFAAEIVVRFIHASMPLGTNYVAMGLAAALLYAGGILTTLWVELVNTAATMAWLARES